MAWTDCSNAVPHARLSPAAHCGPPVAIFWLGANGTNGNGCASIHPLLLWTSVGMSGRRHLNGMPRLPFVGTSFVFLESSGCKDSRGTRGSSQ